MTVYLITTLIVLAAAYMMRRPEDDLVLAKDEYLYCRRGITRQRAVNITCMAIIFTMLFGVSALRINVGNDYSKYVEFMHLTYCNAYVPTEVGFNYLTKIIYTLCGFENYILVFAVFAFGTVLFFLIAMWQQSEKFFWSFGMFMTLGYYFQSISTVRYYLALAIALYSIRFVIRRDWPRFILTILVGSLFHKSLLVVLVLYPLAQIHWRKWMMAACGALCLSSLFLSSVYLKILIRLYPSYQNTEYLEGGTSYVSIFRCAMVIILGGLLYKSVIKGQRNYEFYFRCNIFAFLLYVFGSFIPVVSRIGYYLTVTQIIFVPALILHMPEGRRKNIAKIAAIAFCLLYFAYYMLHAGDDGIRILPYQTFMFHDLPLTLSERGFS